MAHWEYFSFYISKTKEITVDLRRGRGENAAVWISSTAVERVSSWSCHTFRLTRKAQQHLHVLRRLPKEMYLHHSLVWQLYCPWLQGPAFLECATPTATPKDVWRKYSALSQTALASATACFVLLLSGTDSGAYKHKTKQSLVAKDSWAAHITHTVNNALS